MSRSTAPGGPDTYLKLIRRFRLTSIRTEAELDRATEVLHGLLRQDLDAEGRQYLDALTDLIESYEAKAHPIPDAPEADVLRLLMESGGHSQVSLARASGISQSTISAVLTGTRSLTKEQVVVLAQLFNVSPAAFLSASP
jgi:HTH-type transcriptional regulator/antitoxin HigA